MEKERITRRNFIEILTRFSLGLASLLGLGGLVRFFSLSPDRGSQTNFDLGKKGDYPPGSQIIRPDIPAAIYNRNGTLVALSLSCTHLGCALEEDQAGFSCPCHGSMFDEEGIVLAGPAGQDLLILDIKENEDGTLSLSAKGVGK